MVGSNMFFRVNEMTESQNAIYMLREFLTQAVQDEYYLKWVIIAAHNALQGLMVLALKGTSSLQVIKLEDADQCKSAYDLLADPKKKLDSFMGLFKKIKNKKYMQNDIFFDKSGDVADSIKRLNEIRNQFIHYFPCSWSISTFLVYKILTDALKVIIFLTQECSEVKRNFNDQELLNITLVIKECNLLINSHN